ncbi:hypothetical protein TUBRATIS_12370 [Tubulinosema ratisbonensis]|uniref:Uncharacterized protein n=1 Tax=Tubulinosema ratisbonensis TaxID=291195 RepID=A0A437AMQ2_9MICR|nr:hypothetical protein TUBRATIS_12370 [Tubulinosema ratisbonensis]
MLFYFIFILKIKSTSLKEYYVIANRGIHDHFLNNFQDIISLKEGNLDNLQKDDPKVVKFDEKKENHYLIKLGKSFIYREPDALVLKGKELIPDDPGFLFEMVPCQGYGYQIKNGDKCFEVGEDNGPLDGYEILLSECAKNDNQVFILEPVKLSNEPTSDLEREAKLF